MRRVPWSLRSGWYPKQEEGASSNREEKLQLSIERKRLLLLVLGLAAQAQMGFAQSPGTFTQTGTMVVARYQHTATLLNDGQVLIAGRDSSYGQGPNTEASAEVYDPATATFTATGSMTTPRGYHTATLLPNGKVLIAGGGTRINGIGYSLWRLPNSMNLLAADEVLTESGVVSGMHGVNSEIRMFKGIPYAVAPVGDLRWRASDAGEMGGRAQRGSVFHGLHASFQQTTPGARLPR